MMISRGLISNNPEPLFANTSPKIEKTLDINMQTLIQEYVEENEAVGATVGLIEHGEMQFFSYGQKSIQDNELMSEETIFEIGSITKLFTTLILMDMTTNGNVQLDAPIEAYLPDIKTPEFEGKKITLRHLATHHSGLPSLPDNFNPKDPMNPFEDYTAKDLYHFLSHYKLKVAPGESFEYSNIGMGLLGYILSKKEGVDYEELVRSHLCENLEMKNTKITLSNKMEKHFAKGYHKKQEVPHWDIPILAGAGAFRSNIKDMTQFLAASMGLLNSPLNDLLKQCHIIQRPAGPLSDEIGLGWMISHSNTADVIWHNGGTGGFRNFLGFNPKTQKGIVVLSNSSEGWPDAFSLCLLDPETYTKPTINEALAKDLEYLKQFEGSYELIINQQKMDLTIKVKNLELVFANSEGELNLLPESFGVFTLKGMAGQKLRFIFNDIHNILKAQMVRSNGLIGAELLPKGGI